LLLVLFGVFMMRWNVVIGGQAFSLSFSGYMHYHIPIIPHSLETFKEGLFGALTVIATPFVLFWMINKFVPSLERGATSSCRRWRGARKPSTDDVPTCSEHVLRASS
jgi:hypothetical protein